MAYVPSSDVPSAFLISTDADAVLLDLLGTFVLLDGGSEKVRFTKHVRQIDANIISAPTKAALTNAVELNKETIVPLVGNFPNVKAAGSDDSVAALLKSVEKVTEGRPAVTPTRFNSKYEPIVISKSLRTGRLELIVLAGDAKEVEALQKAVETGDEKVIEKAAANHGTISVLVWFPAIGTDPIKRVLHTGTAPLARIVSALEKAKALPYLHSPVVSAANAYKEVPIQRQAAVHSAPKATANNRTPAVPTRAAPPKPTNNNATSRLAATKRPAAPAAPAPASRPTTNSARSAPSSAKPSPARLSTAPSAKAKPANGAPNKTASAPANRTANAAKKTNHEAPIQKTTVAPLKGAAMSRAAGAVGKAVGSVTGKTGGESKPAGKPAAQKDKNDKNAKPPSPTGGAAPAHAAHPDAPSPTAEATAPAPTPSPTPAPHPEEAKEPNTTPVAPKPNLDDSVVCLDDVVPDIAIDAPQDPASSDLRPPVELVVIPPTPEPRSLSQRSSIDGTLDGATTSPVVSPKPEPEKEPEEDQNVLSTDDDRGKPSDASVSPKPDQKPAEDLKKEPEDHKPAIPMPDHDEHLDQKKDKDLAPEHPSDLKDTSPEHPPPTAPARSPSPEANRAPSPKEQKPTPQPAQPEPEPKHDEPVPDHPQGPPHDEGAGDSKPPKLYPELPTPDDSHGETPSPVPKDRSPSPKPETPDHAPQPPQPAPVSPMDIHGAPAEPFGLPSIAHPTPPPPAGVRNEGDIPEEFKPPHTPEEPGENGLLDDLEEPPKLMRISMDTDDLNQALEKGATAVADQLAQCLDNLTLTGSNEKLDDKDLTETKAEVAKEISQQMIQEASTPFTAALASTLAEGTESAIMAASSALDQLVEVASTVSETVVDGVKEAAETVNEKMKAMQTRSSLIEDDGEEEHPKKYEETDPVIDSVLDSVASDSERVDHALSNGSSDMEGKENGKKHHEVDEEGFRVAADSHDTRLFLPPPSARGRAPPVPHLSRPLYFELATVPHFNGKCSLPDEQSAIEYFTNIRSANYILHSEDVSPAVLDGWLTGKKHWLNNGHKTRIIPTRHHSALQAFVTENAAQLEEYGLVMNSSLEHNTISINTEEGREDYHMIKIEL